jgi:hypothetical protein
MRCTDENRIWSSYTGHRCDCVTLVNHLFSLEVVIAKNKNQNTFAKRQREHEKKRKAEDKLARRVRRKETASVPRESSPTEAE